MSDMDLKLNDILSKMRNDPSNYQIFFQGFPYTLVSDKEVINNIKNSDLGEKLKDFSDSAILELIKKFSLIIENERKWFLNSKIRASTFFYLGSSESMTATEIGELIFKHPKSVSNYIHEFKEKGWVDEPEKIGREKKYSLSEAGLSFFKLAKKQGWFNKIIIEQPKIAETIIRVKYYEVIRQDVYLTFNPHIDRSKIPDPDFYEFGESYYFDCLPNEEGWPFHELILRINTIARSLLKELNLERKLPKIKLLEKTLLSINSQNPDDLALVFASFNYLEKNKIKNRDYWSIGQIKVITPDLYFNIDMPDVDESDGFMTVQESKRYMNDIMIKFKEKIKKKKS